MKFGSSKKSNEIVNASKVTVLSLGFELTGDIISKNDIRADGTLRGNIRTDKKVVVGEKASIVGDILADEISISGEVTGDLYINGETTIYPTAKVSGNILTHQIFIQKGAVLHTSIRTADPDEIEKEKGTVQLKSPDLEKTFSLIKSHEEKKEKPAEVERIENGKKTREVEKKEKVTPIMEPADKAFRPW